MASARVLAILGVVLLAASCQLHTHRIGGGSTLPPGVGEESERQAYLLFGLLRLNEVDVQRMAGDLTSYDIETGFTWVDFLLSPLLLPLTVTTRTVTVKR